MNKTNEEFAALLYSDEVEDLMNNDVVQDEICTNNSNIVTVYNMDPRLCTGENFFVICTIREQGYRY